MNVGFHIDIRETGLSEHSYQSIDNWHHLFHICCHYVSANADHLFVGLREQIVLESRHIDRAHTHTRAQKSFISHQIRIMSVVCVK